MVLTRSVLLPLFALCSFVAAQRTTFLDDNGYTVVASVQTDAEGDPTDTTTLIHITTGAAATTATTTGNLEVVAQPAETCTTAGCPVDPTTYTQATTIGGAVTSVIVTWTATTPTTPIPTWTSSGKVLSAAQYMTTTVTASGLSRISSGALSSFPSSGGVVERWMGVGLTVVVGGLLGAVVVL
ncbi:hypothetical protein BCR35DRAFT_303511 [Leucosporidium creatinivorum]|uniref:Uncharacterized protein n=1 Tax=Leucosporidium creatinivorum TaxID=106004 RepID=A0A1Y2FG13_9BASI|nr:hypothetical protein BCR35DRAFT_303511 [Leucosporidium creatinivorum]